MEPKVFLVLMGYGLGLEVDGAQSPFADGLGLD